VTATSAPLTSAVIGGRTNRFAIVLLVAVVVAVVVVGALTSSGDRPYGLEDTSDLGYAGLSQTLGRLGASLDEIDAGAVGPRLVDRYDTVFVPGAAGMSGAQRAAAASFARAGGRVVLAGVPSGAVAAPSSGLVVVGRDPGACDIEVLRGLGRIDPAGESAITVGTGRTSCYGDGEAALVVSEGGISTVAGPGLFTNAAMRPRNQEVDDPKGPMPDNVVVAQRLLAPGGGGRIAVVTSGVAPDAGAAGGRTIWSQMPEGVRLGLWELVIAVVVFAVFRARRLGRIVVEHQPVSIAGSELVSAVGNLMERRNDPAHAAALLRSDACERLARAVGLGPGAPLALLSPVVAARAHRAPDDVAALLGGSVVSTDAQLAELARQLDQLTQEILGD